MNWLTSYMAQEYGDRLSAGDTEGYVEPETRQFVTHLTTLDTDASTLVITFALMRCCHEVLNSVL